MTYASNTQVTYTYNFNEDFTQLATIRLQNVSDVSDLFFLTLTDSDLNQQTILGTVDGNDIVWIINDFVGVNLTSIVSMDVGALNQGTGIHTTGPLISTAI